MTAQAPVVRASDDNSPELVALVLAHDTSVRLHNSVVAAANAGTLPFASVRDYLAAGAMAVPTMMRDVRHFGAKSARELDLLIKATGDVTAAAAEIITPARDGPSPQEILEGIEHLSLAQAIEGELLSVRLQNGLAAPDLRTVRFSTVALALDDFLATLRTRPNIGRTSVKEMAGLVRRLTPRLLAEYGVPPAQIARTCEALFGENHAADADEVADDVPQFETLAACLDWLLTQCEARDRLIIERRFGLGQTPSETLEDIGSDYGVTRERIRQIEKRALKRMRVRMRRIPLADHIAAALAGWLQISEGRGWISDRQADGALRKLDGVLQLGLELVETSPRTWLSAIATRAAHGWIGAPIDPDLTRTAAIDLGALLKLPLPRSLSEAGGYDRLHIEAALRIELGLELEQGYVVQSKPGPRMRRALGLHRLLVSASAPLAAQHLIPRYHQLCPTDPCSARDADIVMQAAPHLFIETFDQVWFGIGACGDPPMLDDPEAYVRNDSPPYEEQNAEDDGETCAEALIAALERRGPERLLTLYQNAEDVLPPGRSSNSVGPTLLSNPHIFVRLLPGVYGLHHQVPSPDQLLVTPPPYLLDNNQLRLLALARRAGERRDVFPLWSLEGEFALARWGRHHGAPENFRSLLAVADIAAWPISPSERTHWQEMARREGRFELADAPRQDAYVRPELDRLLAACIEAVNAGVLNWMAVNRMAGRRIDSHAAASVMAILLALGALHCDSADPSAWQRPHRATDRAENLFAQMIDELSSTGTLAWDHGTGLKLQDDIRAAGTDMRGWPEPGRLAEMFEGRGSAPIASGSMVIDPLDAIMAESRQSAERQKREDLLRWLLEE
ncbi:MULTISPECIES: sigma factor-like helix-turn-helix DNA-binding protein [Mesorhizobium]|uniref:sigma factor-like helix-turn-helix DNA-binding protein n=1 Tax=Mesorhizobium TaxID=68287 RepID=UPI001FD91138|nr:MULTISPECIES: sigma factor-like helix-turn-helix DNA-binding protein [Mesorhizobium]